MLFLQEYVGKKQSALLSFTPWLQPGDLGPIETANRFNGFLRCASVSCEHFSSEVSSEPNHSPCGLASEGKTVATVSQTLSETTIPLVALSSPAMPLFFIARSFIRFTPTNRFARAPD